MTAADDRLFEDTPETDESVKLIRQQKPGVTSRNIRSSHEYKVTHDAYRQICARRRQDDGSYGDPCIRCDEPIDYNLQYPHLRSWSLEHLIPVSERPELLLDRNNFASAHFVCNSVAGAGGVESELGEPSEVWD